MQRVGGAGQPRCSVALLLFCIDASRTARTACYCPHQAPPLLDKPVCFTPASRDRTRELFSFLRRRSDINIIFGIVRFCSPLLTHCTASLLIPPSAGTCRVCVLTPGLHVPAES
ncbi:hypothetical protein HDV63DRAFT_361844 [Trichoderma sp. SZMC 28014]